MKTLKVGVDKLPAPRLQLRWEPYTGVGARLDDQFYGYNWQCFYELVLPLGEVDRRRTTYDSYGNETGEQEELVKLLSAGPTKRRSTQVPCHNDDGSTYADTPIGDGYHAHVDSVALGGLPVYVIDHLGNAFLKEWKVWPSAG